MSDLSDYEEDDLAPTLRSDIDDSGDEEAAGFQIVQHADSDSDLDPPTPTSQGGLEMLEVDPASLDDDDDSSNGVAVNLADITTTTTTSSTTATTTTTDQETDAETEAKTVDAAVGEDATLPRHIHGGQPTAEDRAAGIAKVVHIVKHNGKVDETFIFTPQSTVLGLKRAILQNCGFDVSYNVELFSVLSKGIARENEQVFFQDIFGVEVNSTVADIGKLFVIVDDTHDRDTVSSLKSATAATATAKVTTRETKSSRGQGGGRMSVIDQKLHRSRQSSNLQLKATRIEGNYVVSRFGDIVQKQPTVEGKVVVEVEDKTTAQKKAHAQKLLRDLARDSKWLAMLQDWETIQTKKQKLLKTRVRKGIPSGLRRFVWPPLAALADFKNKHPQGFYQSLLLRSLPQKHDEQLKKDLPRIAQENTYFKSPESGSRSVVCQGQLALYNVFKAYCIYDPNVGYVQGMDSIGCPCVMHMEEEDAFWMLVTLLNGPKYGLKGLYTDGMPLAFTYIGVFELFLRRLAPRVYRKLQDEGVQTMGYAFRWLTTRFNLFPVELRLRILDIFINEGMKIIYRLSLYLVLSHKREILNGDMESIMMLFQGMYCDPKMFDADRVIAEAEKTVRITTRQMQEYTREYYQANISGVNAV